jgi:hypothetical protein
MASVVILASPWWVNLLILAPLVSYVVWRGKGLELSRRQLFHGALFAVAFGFVEAAVVIYLRAAAGLLPGYGGTLADVARLSAELYQRPPAAVELPPSLLHVEIAREAATILMLLSLALLAAKTRRERWAMFLWVFAWWDISYYASLWATVRWPPSLATEDILFLIPTPWISQVWFPVLVSVLTLAAVVGGQAAKAKGKS